MPAEFVETEVKESTVMFADIVGSTQMYEILGDNAAEQLISATLKQLSGIVLKAEGEIIKTIGDEIMCRFDHADQALIAAQEMHEFLLEKTAPSKEYKVAIRIGAHQGTLIESEGDIFGDTVNVSARVAGLARPGKTMITGYTYRQLSSMSQDRCQHFTRTVVKGKDQPIDIYDVVWEQTEELTQIVGNISSELMLSRLTIEFNENKIFMSPNTVTRLSVGRGKTCDLIVPSAQASREHCLIECNRGKFVFTDNSANGTYIEQNGTELLFHQERIPLIGEGSISLGEPFEENTRFVIHYSVTKPS